MTHITNFLYWDFSLASTTLEFANVINTFFAFSFLGFIMECIVLSIEKKNFITNRGFVHGPFCIIYGFGATLGFFIMRPLNGNYFILFIVGAMLATAFEFLTAKLMLKCFDNLWWDYSKKPFNYKGILCLESTLGWGVIAVLIVSFLYNTVYGICARIPSGIAIKISILLVAYYVIDFAVSIYNTVANEENEAEQDTEKTISEDTAK